MMMDFIFIFIALLLVLMNAFFVAAEFSMVKLRHTQVAAIQNMYGIRGQILAHIHQRLDAYLSACQLGITLSSLGLGWVGEPAFAHLLEPIFHLLNIHSSELIQFVTFFIAFSIISFLHIVIGELMPKSLAIRQSERVSIWTSLPLYGFYWIMYPATWLLNSCSNFLLKITGCDKVHRGESFYSTDEIKLILNTSHLFGELSKDETDILAHTLDFSDLNVTDVMRPYARMVMVNKNQPIEETLKIMSEHHYSRYPVYDDSQHDIIGILHVKDIFSAFYQQQHINNIDSFLRPVLKISYQLPAIDLLREFQEGMPHFALVYKGQSTLLGFITLDNLLHVLIGRIKDEFHPTQDDWIMNPDGSLLVRGDCSIFTLERALDKEIQVAKEESATLIGLILNRLGRLPHQGEQLQFEEFIAIIQKVQGSHITEVKIVPTQKGKTFFSEL
jgi:CBS domain containing-hemolysin-like protein